jgi:hypothetical protein
MHNRYTFIDIRGIIFNIGLDEGHLGEIDDCEVYPKRQIVRCANTNKKPVDQWGVRDLLGSWNKKLGRVLRPQKVERARSG